MFLFPRKVAVNVRMKNGTLTHGVLPTGERLQVGRSVREISLRSLFDCLRCEVLRYRGRA